MSEFLKRLDPEFKPMFEAQIPSLSDILKEDITQGRALFDQMMKMMVGMGEPFDGQTDDYMIAGLDGDPDLKIFEYQKRDMLFPDTVIVWLHGGGYLIGAADDFAAQGYCSLAPVISVDYRMAPEHRAPAAARDACAAILHAAERNPRKIVIAGPSAGAGLAACATLMNRDRGGPQIDFQLLLYPMLDDTHDTPSGHMDIPSATWTRDISMHAWSLYAEEGGASQYAAAARATDLSGLPPAYIMSGDLDLFLDEDIAYANRLRDAGVPVELAIYPGAPHGFNGFNPGAAVSQRANAAVRLALEHALK